MVPMDTQKLTWIMVMITTKEYHMCTTGVALRTVALPQLMIAELDVRLSQTTLHQTHLPLNPNQIKELFYL
jgi:hypothetical protein